MGEFDLCYLFATCDSYQDCPACVTGDEQCWQTLGGDCSLAPTPAPTLSPTTETTTITTATTTMTTATSMTTETTTMTTAECPDGWEVKPEFGKCYYYVDAVTWSEANERCAALDPDNKATLTSVRSKEENDYILSLSDLVIWLGGTDEDEEGVWRWTEDGSLVEEDGSFTNWYPGGVNGDPQPDGDGNCMYMYNDGTWIDVDC